MSIYTLYSNTTPHSHNFFFNIPPSYSPFFYPLSILLTIQLQSLFFFFILYLPIITNSILFFQLNSLYINFNYYPIHLYPIIYTNPLIIYFNFNTSHQLTLSHHIPNCHLLLTVSLFTFLSITYIYMSTSTFLSLTVTHSTISLLFTHFHSHLVHTHPIYSFLPLTSILTLLSLIHLFKYIYHTSTPSPNLNLLYNSGYYNFFNTILAPVPLMSPCHTFPLSTP